MIDWKAVRDKGKERKKWKVESGKNEKWREVI
jgi:hypothetical protein